MELAKNYCRNPTRDRRGPWCYTLDSTVIDEECDIPFCDYKECRMAGTANDYIGTLSTTRSGRTCAKWLKNYNFEQIQRSNASLKTKPSSRFLRLIRTKSLSKRYLMTKQNLLTSSQLFMKPPSLNLSQSGFKIDKHINFVDQTYLNDSLYPELSVQKANNYCRNPSRNIAGTWCYTTDPLVPQDLCNIRDCEKSEECTFFVKGHGIGRRLYVLPEYRTEGLRFSLKTWEPDHPDSITFVFTADDGLKSRYILKIGAFDNEKVLLYYESEEKDIILVKKKTLPHLLYLGKWSNFIIRIPRGHVLLYYEGTSNPLFEWKHPEPSKAFLPIYYYYNSEKGHAIGVAFDCASRCHIENTQTNRYTRILPLSIWSKEDVVRPNKLMLMIRAKGVVLIPLLLLPATSGFYALTLGERDIDGPPLDGGWSEWGPWTCSVSCNGGIGTRNTITLIKKVIAYNHTAFTVKEYASVSLPSDSNIVNTIRIESPNSEIQWSHNGIFIQNNHRREIKDYEIIINRTALNDSGVYTLTVHRIDGIYMIIKVITLAVVPIKESITIRETLPMHITCHCAILGYVYSNLKIYWMINGNVWKDYGVTLPVATNVDYVPTINKSHHGIWKCIVEQTDLKFKWTTNVIRVKGTKYI
ncbi:Plasminogen [Acromyrmex echinatior]|uniref:Plasminogen n=1 Tax=Acromyrmex echinatior TaxID=103372 RepID=F4WNQ5_ACREC|nr:Plasminogen [Acromyrmex echinatior]